MRRFLCRAGWHEWSHWQQDLFTVFWFRKCRICRKSQWK